jgi:hypothetical protein
VWRQVPLDPPASTFVVNLALHTHTNKGPKGGYPGGLYSPSCLRVKRLHGHLDPIKSPFDPYAGGA